MSAFAQSPCGTYLQWNSSAVYWANDQTEYQGKVYKAKWWTQNNTPSNDPNGPWVELSTCTLPNIVNPNSLCNGVNAWENQKIYNTNDIVVYNNQKYKAKWWTQNNIPNSSDAWELVSVCLYSTITVQSSMTDFVTTVGTASQMQSFTVNGANLSSNVVITAPLHFELSLNGEIFSQSLSIVPNSGSLALTTIYVRYNPYQAGSHLGKITVESIGFATKEISVSGYSQSPWIAKGTTTLFNNPAFKNIGIGTDNVPETYKLGVNGKIIAKGLKIQFEGWADKVFDENYELLSLQEIETYVKEHKHLPGIPAEKEVLKDGMSIEEMNVLLLQKVEELTLLLIEQNNKVLQLEETVNNLKVAK